MTPSRSGRATPTPSRGATGRSQWDYMASPAPSPVRAGTGKSMSYALLADAESAYLACVLLAYAVGLSLGLLQHFGLIAALQVHG